MSAPDTSSAGALRAAIRAKLPGLAKRGAAGSRLACIRLFCVECMGGNAGDARRCESRDCFLWPVRGAAWKERP